MIDLNRLALIRDEDQAVLRDPAGMNDVVGRLGLIGEYPEWGLPPSLAEEVGRGLLLSQYPVQLGPFLVFLAEQPIDSYLEIGTQHGGTFATMVTYLQTTGHPIKDAVSIDVNWAPGVAEFSRQTPAVRSLVQSSQDSRDEIESTPWGLVLIDGDHSYDACREDFTMAHRSGARMIAMHDVVDHASPGARQVWKEVQAAHAADYAFQEFVAQYPEVVAHSGETHLGIGVATRLQ